MATTVPALDIQGNSHELNVDDLRWRPAAYGIVIKGSKLLVLPEPNGFGLPGGGLKLGESPEAGAIREIWEETGIKVTNLRPFTFSSNFFLLPASDKGREVQSILMYYLCDYASGELTDAEHDEYEHVNSGFPEWLPLDQLDTIKVNSSSDWRDIVRQAVGL
jgi:8-oxo-dGTP pyrophosphatase MutT (NUDIX family)